jgi:hypothetical protein
VVVPYFTIDVAFWSVVQRIDAVVKSTGQTAMLLITGAPAVAVVKRKLADADDVPTAFAEMAA